MNQCTSRVQLGAFLSWRAVSGWRLRYLFILQCEQQRLHKESARCDASMRIKSAGIL